MTKNKISLQIVTPDGIFLEQDVSMVVVATGVGKIGLQHGKSPFVAALTINELVIDPSSSSSRIFAIGGGHLRVNPDSIKIITDDIVLKADIDKAKVNFEVEKAKEKLHQKLSNSEHLKTQLLLKKALNKKKVGNF